MDGRLVGGLCSVRGGRGGGRLPIVGAGAASAGAVADAGVGVGGTEVLADGGCPPLSIASAFASWALDVRAGRVGQVTSPFQTGDAAGMTGGVSPLHRASAAQGVLLAKTIAHLAQRRLLRALMVSMKTATWADVDDARMGRVVMWNRRV